MHLCYSMQLPAGNRSREAPVVPIATGMCKNFVERGRNANKQTNYNCKLRSFLQMQQTISENLLRPNFLHLSRLYLKLSFIDFGIGKHWEYRFIKVICIECICCSFLFTSPGDLILRYIAIYRDSKRCNDGSPNNPCHHPRGEICWFVRLQQWRSNVKIIQHQSFN